MIYKENAAENLAVVLYLGLNILRHDKHRKLSVPRKMRALMMDEDYLDTVSEVGLGKVSFKKLTLMLSPWGQSPLEQVINDADGRNHHHNRVRRQIHHHRLGVA